MALLVPALLKYWRKRRGISQLELAFAARVSPRHLSFVESGRSKPSREMLLRILHALDVPLRAQNDVLQAAGFERRFAEPPADALPPEIEGALSLMLEHHEPYPMTVLSLDSNVLRTNRGARALFEAFVAEPALLDAQPDLFTLLLHPAMLRPFVTNWAELGRGLVSRLQREALQRPDPRLDAALERVMQLPEIPEAWRQPDFSLVPRVTPTLELVRGALRLRFVVAVTTFSAPEHVTLEELRLESCLPLDARTREAMRELTGPPSQTPGDAVYASATSHAHRRTR